MEKKNIWGMVTWYLRFAKPMDNVMNQQDLDSFKEIAKTDMINYSSRK